MYVGLFVVYRAGSHDVFVDYFYFALAASAIARIGMAVFVYAKHVHRPGTRYRFELLDSGRVRTLLVFGFFPWMSHLMLRGLLRADFWFVQHFEGLERLGLYSVASNLGETLYLVPNTLGLVVLSYMADPETRGRTTEQTAMIARLFFPMMLIGAVAFSTVSSWFFGFAFGPEFRESGPVFNLLLWGIVPFSLATVMTGFLTGANQVRHILIAASAGLFLTLVLDVLLVPRFGLTGAAIGRGVGLNAMTWYLVVRFHRTTGTAYRDFMLPKASDVSRVIDLLKRKGR
jgi:O-antigen/teichoic acid export membrane protein